MAQGTADRAVYDDGDREFGRLGADDDNRRGVVRTMRYLSVGPARGVRGA